MITYALLFSVVSQSLTDNDLRLIVRNPKQTPAAREDALAELVSRKPDDPATKALLKWLLYGGSTRRFRLQCPEQYMALRQIQQTPQGNSWSVPTIRRIIDQARRRFDQHGCKVVQSIKTLGQAGTQEERNMKLLEGLSTGKIPIVTKHIDAAQRRAWRREVQIEAAKALEAINGRSDPGISEHADR